MAARKKGARRPSPARGAPPSRLWPAKLAVVALRLFAGAIFLAVAKHKLIDPGFSFGETVKIFTEYDYIPLVEHAVAHPPDVLGWKMQWFSDFLGAVMLGGRAPYVIAGGVLVFEALLGFTLVLGMGVRLMAFLGALLMASMGLCKGLYFLTVSTGSNWYLTMILLTLALTGAGRVGGLDRWLRRRLPGWIS